MSVEISPTRPACHRRCPDLLQSRFDENHKAIGLSWINKIRKDVREKQLTPLRTQRTELVNKANNEDTTPLERTRLAKEIDRIDRKAQRIQERWS